MQALLSTNLIPDPYGAYHHFRVPKQPGKPLGVSFGFRPAFSHSSSSSSQQQQQQQQSSSSSSRQTIQITKIAPTSVLRHHTTIQCGQELIAINGHAPITSPQQALSMIQQSSRRSSVDGQVEIKTLYKPSCCYTATLPINRLYASIHFSDNRRGMIVSVGRVFTNHHHHNMPPCSSTTGSHDALLPKEGDLVLSVNGTPVKQARGAEKLIVDACRAGKTFIELYCLDLDALVYKVAKQVAKAVPDRLSPYGMVITKDNQSTRMTSRLEAKCDYIIACGNTNTAKGNNNGGCKARFVLDRADNTLLLVNAEPYRHLELSTSDHSSLQLEKRYRKVIFPFVQDLNAVLEQNMRLLEEAICHRVWEHAVVAVSLHHEQQQQQQRQEGEAAAITTTYPDDSTAAVGAAAPLSSQGGDTSRGDGTIPMATVMAQVINIPPEEEPPPHQPEPTEVVIQVPSAATRRIPPQPLLGGEEDENQGMVQDADDDDDVDPEVVV